MQANPDRLERAAYRFWRGDTDNTIFTIFVFHGLMCCYCRVRGILSEVNAPLYKKRMSN